MKIFRDAKRKTLIMRLGRACEKSESTQERLLKMLNDTKPKTKQAWEDDAELTQSCNTINTATPEINKKSFKVTEQV